MALLVTIWWFNALDGLENIDRESLSKEKEEFDRPFVRVINRYWKEEQTSKSAKN